MCGIVGSLGRHVTDRLIEDFSVSMTSMNDRGPDNSQRKLINQSTIIGHTRLSIIDLTNGSNQPFQDQDCYIVFNGEIYNYKKLRQELVSRNYCFRTESDTEVLLAYYREFGIQRTLLAIEGMFAFCILDLGRSEVYLARDRFGQKPLFFNASEGLCFSSTIESLNMISDPGAINKDVIGSYVYTRFVTGRHTVFSNVEKVSPGEYITADFNSGSIKSRNLFWHPRYSLSKKKHDLDEVESLIKNSVEEHLVSDVPVALFLSGGVDSSLISYYASQINSDVEAINVRFKGQHNDEVKYAEYVAGKLNINLHKIEVDKFGSETFDYIQMLIKKVGQPFSDPALISQYLVAKEASELGYKVVLTGDGGDEMFGGYSIYRKAQLFRMSRFLPNFLYKDFKKLNEINGIKDIYFNNSRSEMILSSCTNNDDLFEGFGKIDYMSTFSNLDIREKLANEFLPKVDTASMAASIECRSPFLDHKIFEYVWSSDYNQLASLITAKRPLKKLAAKYFGRRFAYRNKSGFEAPVESWLKSNDVIFNHVFSSNRKIFLDGLIDFNKVYAEVRTNDKLLWRYFCLILWYENEA